MTDGITVVQAHRAIFDLHAEAAAHQASVNAASPRDYEDHEVQISEESRADARVQALEDVIEILKQAGVIAS